MISFAFTYSFHGSNNYTYEIFIFFISLTRSLTRKLWLNKNWEKGNQILELISFRRERVSDLSIQNSAHFEQGIIKLPITD